MMQRREMLGRSLVAISLPLVRPTFPSGPLALSNCSITIDQPIRLETGSKVENVKVSWAKGYNGPAFEVVGDGVVLMNVDFWGEN